MRNGSSDQGAGRAKRRPTSLKKPNTAATDDRAIQAKVTLVEPLGADINLYAAAGAHKLTARVAPHHLFKCGETVTFRPFLEKARYFDKDTEGSILPAKWDEQAG